MPLTPGCPRCRAELVDGTGLEETEAGKACPVHGSLPWLWLPAEATYDEFADHLRVAGDFPTYLPWPMGPGWSVTDFGVVCDGPDRPLATVTCCSGVSQLDGPVDVFVIAEETGVGLGARCAGLSGEVAGAELGHGPPAVRVRVDSQQVPLWPVSTSEAHGELDRAALAGEAVGRWLWMVLRPASALLLLRDDWILRDVSSVGPPLIEMSFGGPRPGW